MRLESGCPAHFRRGTGGGGAGEQGFPTTLQGGESLQEFRPYLTTSDHHPDGRWKRSRGASLQPDKGGRLVSPLSLCWGRQGHSFSVVFGWNQVVVI